MVFTYLLRLIVFKICVELLKHQKFLSAKPGISLQYLDFKYKKNYKKLLYIQTTTTQVLLSRFIEAPIKLLSN